MRLYVWEDVLRDYTPGMIVALAPDLDTAIQIVREQSHWAASEMSKPNTMINLGDNDRIAPRAWICYGGA